MPRAKAPVESIEDIPSAASTKSDLPSDIPDQGDIPDVPEAPPAVADPPAPPVPAPSRQVGNTPMGAALMDKFFGGGDGSTQPRQSNNNNSNIPAPPPLPEPKKRGRPSKSVTFTDPLENMTPKQKESALTGLNKTMLGIHRDTTPSPKTTTAKQSDTDYLFEQGRLISRIDMYRKLGVGKSLLEKDNKTPRVFKVGQEDNRELLGIEGKLKDELAFKDAPEFLMMALDSIFKAASQFSQSIPLMGLNGMDKFIEDREGGNPLREEFQSLCTEIALEHNMMLGPEKRLVFRVLYIAFFCRQMNMRAYRYAQQHQQRMNHGEQPPANVNPGEYTDL